MMTSNPKRAYVWFWLPERREPLLAGRLDQAGLTLNFTYSPDFLERSEAIPIYRDLPLKEGLQRPRYEIHGSIADAGPDSWGQRVIISRHASYGRNRTADLTALDFLVQAGSDRIGALDFQVESGAYRERETEAASLEDLVQAAEMIENGTALPPSLEDALIRGSSIGGARPKALLDDGGRKLIAKFASTTDTYPVVQCEYVASRLAALCGLSTVKVDLVESMNKKVLIVERFDRPDNGIRRAMVSALTILGLGEAEARYASYAELGHKIREGFSRPAETLKELFSRITFNILISNLDDHARNQSAFWNGAELELTPFYDICPSPRSTGETQQVMEIGEDGWRFSQLQGCIKRSGTYQLTEAEAREIVDLQVATIETKWHEVCDEAKLTKLQRDSLWKKQFLNPFAFEQGRS